MCRLFLRMAGVMSQKERHERFVRRQKLEKAKEAEKKKPVAKDSVFDRWEEEAGE